MGIKMIWRRKKEYSILEKTPIKNHRLILNLNLKTPFVHQSECLLLFFVNALSISLSIYLSIYI